MLVYIYQGQDFGRITRLLCDVTEKDTEFRQITDRKVNVLTKTNHYLGTCLLLDPTCILDVENNISNYTDKSWLEKYGDNRKLYLIAFFFKILVGYMLIILPMIVRYY